MSKVFFRSGNIYTQGDDSFEMQTTLDNGVYQIHFVPEKREFYLERIQNEFIFGFKLYGVDETLTKHVVDTYNKQPVKRNIGVLLNGAKGTGKTVTAKLIANKIGLPVLICDTPYPGLAQFLSGINHDCIFFFDEFEKNFRMKCDNEDCAGEDLLSIMDGVYNSEHCHIFLLTTNDLKVNDNLISRPSRIRYLKSFGEVISRKVLEEFIDDTLIYPERREEIISFVDSLSMATIDIVKCIVEEVNIHNCGVDTFKNFFNVKKASYRYYTQTKCDYLSYGEPIKKDVFIMYFNISYKQRQDMFDWSPEFETIVLDRDIRTCNVGDKIYNDWVVEEIDTEANYMRAKRVNGSSIKHFRFENMDTSPSVYDSIRHATYGYQEYDW